MSVQVRDSGETEEHATGSEIVVADGHLLVKAMIRGGGFRTIAAYPPGQWQAAVVVEAQA